jgi:hypothetical protein
VGGVKKQIKGEYMAYKRNIYSYAGGFIQPLCCMQNFFMLIYTGKGLTH